MPLLGASVLKADLAALKPSDNKSQACKDLASVIGKYTKNLQAGPFGTPGIVVFNESLFASLLETIPLDPSGGISSPMMAMHWQTAMIASQVKPGTVMFPGWTASMSDVQTPPSVAAACPTLSLAFSTLQSGLKKSETDKEGPKLMAEAFHKALLELKFLTIGLVLAPPAPPIPLPQNFSAM
jgi:hypothetical protein